MDREKETKGGCRIPMDHTKDQKEAGKSCQIEGKPINANDGKEKENEEERLRKKNPFRKAIDAFEQMLIFSVLYIHSSPLQPLIGPGCATSENFLLVHACYFAIALFVPLAYIFANFPGIRTYLSNDANLCMFVESKETCVDIVSDLFTNRFSLAIASLFMFMSLITMKCFATNEYTRPSLHNGFWILKLMFIFIVSLIAFSIPPALFDSIWQYVCTSATLIQTFLMIFLLLDWTNWAKHKFLGNPEPQARGTKKLKVYQIFFCIFPLSLLILSFAGVSYITHYSQLRRGFSLIDLAMLLVLLKFTVAVYFFAKRDVSSLLQCTVILCYILFRFGLSMACQIPCPKCRNIYIFIDVNFKLITVAYALFRVLQPNQYTINGSTIYGYASQANLALYKQTAGNFHKVDNTKLENIKRSQEVSKANDDETSHDDISTEKNKIYVNKEYENNEAMLQTCINNQCSSSVQAYSYSFLHFLLLTTCLDTNADLTSFKVLAERNSKFELENTRFSILILHTSVVIIPMTFVWSKLMKTFYDAIDEYSILSIIKTFAKTALDILVRIIIEPPVQLLRVKYLYLGLFAMHLTICLLLLSPAIKMQLEKSSLFCSQKTKQGRCLSIDPSLVAMYQVSFSITVFFVLMMILLAGVTTSKNPRNNIHVGFWPSKLLFLGLIFATSFYLPTDIGSIWTHMGLAATLIVTLLQTVVVLDFTSRLLDRIREKEENSVSPRKIHFSCSSIAIFLYTLTITAFFCFYVYFAQFSACKSNRIFICINLGLCTVASLISLHPAVQTGGLVQSAIITSFCMYCTWTALYNNPREECNPLTQVIFESDVKPTKALLFAVDTAAFAATSIYVTVYIKRIQDFLRQFTLVCFQVQCLRPAPYYEAQRHFFDLTQISFQDALFGKERKNNSFMVPLSQNEDREIEPHGRNIKNDAKTEETKQSHITEHETDDSTQNPYNYSFFHMIYALLIMHLFTLMVTWTDERPGSHIKISFHWAIMCIRMVASSASVILYIWSLVVHLFWNMSCRYS